MATNTRTITAANTKLLISVDTIFPVPQLIQGYSADNVVGTDSISPKETQMGVDGRLSAGWTAVQVPMTVNLMADSLSRDFFEQWADYEQQQRESLVASGTLIFPSLGTKYSLVRGFLVSFPRFPNATKVMQPTAYGLQWEQVTPAPV
jgi:hypothetical protein